MDYTIILSVNELTAKRLEIMALKLPSECFGVEVAQLSTVISFQWVGSRLNWQFPLFPLPATDPFLPMSFLTCPYPQGTALSGEEGCSGKSEAGVLCSAVTLILSSN